jgi:hypothetical protein
MDFSSSWISHWISEGVGSYSDAAAEGFWFALCATGVAMVFMSWRAHRQEDALLGAILGVLLFRGPHGGS